MEEKKSRFTEEDERKLELLPETERRDFLIRFAKLSMDRRIADDLWEETIDKIGERADRLITDIKERLTVLDEKGG
jgi:hypothetical protein